MFRYNPCCRHRPAYAGICGISLGSTRLAAVAATTCSTVTPGAVSISVALPSAKVMTAISLTSMAQDDTTTEIGSLRANVANSEIGVDSLRATTGEIHQRIERIEAARDATGSIAKSPKHQSHKK